MTHTVGLRPEQDIGHFDEIMRTIFCVPFTYTINNSALKHHFKAPLEFDEPLKRYILMMIWVPDGTQTLVILPETRRCNSETETRRCGSETRL